MHLLVAIDRSTESRNALTTALDIANAVDGKVTAVHAIPDAASDGEESFTQRGESILADAVARAQKRGSHLESELLVGDPVESITTFAESNDVDVIYVGHRGLASERDALSGEQRGPLGSVAKGIVEGTQIPVTVFDSGL